MSPAFGLTEYKVLGSTYKNAVLDLRRHSKVLGEDASHKRNCSVYCQLSRLQSKKGLQLLQRLSLSDLDNKMHPQLRDEDHRLQRLADMTMRLETEGVIAGELEDSWRARGQ
jgi:hypothetical protein